MLQTDIFYRFNSNLNFSGNLELNAGKELNVKEATISSQNINQEGLDTSKITTKEVKKEEIKPQYGDIAKGAAITGAIAGAAVTAKEFMQAFTNAEPTFETGKGDPTMKPTPDLAKSEAFKLQNPDYKGVIDPKAPNIGMANETSEIAKVGTKVLPGEVQSLVHEGSLIMQGANKIPGMNFMSVFHDTWADVAGFGGTMTKLTIIPSIPFVYFGLGGGVGAGIISNSLLPETKNNNEPKSMLIK